MTTQTLQYEDFLRVEAKLDNLDSKLDTLLERQRFQKDLVEEFAPIAREAMRVGADKLSTLERAGYFAFARQGMALIDYVVQSYSEDDVRLLADNVVGIIDTVKNVTQPSVLAVANEATELLSHPDELEPVGVMGMMKASQDEDVKKGTAIMLEILRQVGRGASKVAENRAHEARIPAQEKPTAQRAEQAKAAPVPAPKAASSGDGWELGDDGHLLDASQWDKEFAAAMAASLGVTVMGSEHWKVIEFARSEWLETQAAPNIRRLTSGSGVATKQLYQLFPKAPARTVAKLAGIPKPAGCI